MIISLLKFVKQYIVKSYKSIIKFINNMFLLIVVFVLGLFNNFKSYLKSLYLKKNNQIIFILALPLIYDLGIRYILKGFERNYQTGVPSNQLNTIRLFSSLATQPGGF